MKILVIDGQGGKLGRTLIEKIRMELPNENIICIGTTQGATGENAVYVCAADADIIAGPIGIVIADSLLGEITPKIALSVSRSKAKKILIPYNKCGTVIAGTDKLSLTELISECVGEISSMAKKEV